MMLISLNKIIMYYWTVWWAIYFVNLYIIQASFLPPLFYDIYIYFFGYVYLLLSH